MSHPQRINESDLKSLSSHQNKLTKFLSTYREDISGGGEPMAAPDPNMAPSRVAANEPAKILDGNSKNDTGDGADTLESEPQKPPQNEEKTGNPTESQLDKNKGLTRNKSFFITNLILRAKNQYDEGKFEMALATNIRACDLGCELMNASKILQVTDLSSSTATSSATIHSSSSIGESDKSCSYNHYVLCKIHAAQCSIRLKQFEAAAQYASEALAKDMENVKALFMRGLSYMASGQGDKARADLNLSAVLDPSLEVEVKRLLEYDRLKAQAGSLYMDKKFEEAIEVYKEAANKVNGGLDCAFNGYVDKSSLGSPDVFQKSVPLKANYKPTFASSPNPFITPDTTSILKSNLGDKGGGRGEGEAGGEERRKKRIASTVSETQTVCGFDASKDTASQSTETNKGVVEPSTVHLTMLGSAFVNLKEDTRNGTILHFGTQIDDCYVGYEKSVFNNQLTTLDDDSPFPLIKPIINSSFDPATRTFRGTTSWPPPATFTGFTEINYLMVFSQDFTSIVDGDITYIDGDGSKNSNEIESCSIRRISSDQVERKELLFSIPIKSSSAFTRAVLNAICLNNEAQCFMKLNDFDNAISSATTALALDPKNAKALYRRGMSYLKKNDLRLLGDAHFENNVLIFGDLKAANFLDPGNKEVEKELKVSATICLFDLFLSGYLIQKLDSHELIKRHEFVVIHSTNLLDLGADLNYKTNKGKNVLAYAISQGSLGLVELFLSRGASVIDKTSWVRGGCARSDIWSPIHLASHVGHYKIVDLLLSKGANVDDVFSHIENGQLDTARPLNFAINGGHTKCVELLLSKGAAVNYTDKIGRSPLLMASMEGGREIVELLLLNGATVSDTHLLTAIAAKEESQVRCEIAELVISKGARVNAKGLDGITPLWAASRNGNLKIAELFLSKGALVDAKAHNDSTSLMIASEKGHTDIIRLLLANGASVNGLSPDRTNLNKISNPLYFASQGGHLEATKLLLASGASVNGNGESIPLVIACIQGHLSVVELLISKGASVHDRDKGKGNITALHPASENGYLEIVAVLLNNGAKTDCVDSEGISPLFFASLRGHLEVVELLLSRGSDINFCTKDRCVQYPLGISPLVWIAAASGHDKIVELLLMNGADVNEKYEGKGSTPLYIASNLGHVKTMEMLISHGANIHEKDNDDFSPIMIACFNNRLEAVELLINHGADINTEEDGLISCSPISFSLMKSNVQLYQLLLSRGGNCCTRSRDGTLNSANIMFYQVPAFAEIAEKWTISMAIIIFKELRVFSTLDSSLLDLQEFLGPMDLAL